MMDNETWILPEEAVGYGFATAIEKTKQKNASQNARQSLFNIIKMAQQAEDEEEGEETDEDEETPPDDENPVEPEEPPESEDTGNEENPEDEAEEEETKEESEEEQEEAAQRLSGFFNAFLKFERR